MPDLQVTIVDPVTGIVSLGVPNPPKLLYGMDLLVQIVALKVLKNFGRNVFDPQEGTDFRNDIGQFNFAMNDIEEIRNEVVGKIDKIEKDIIAEQGTNIGSPLERLAQLTLLDVAIDPDTSDTAIRVRIVNEAGITRDVVV